MRVSAAIQIAIVLIALLPVGQTWAISIRHDVPPQAYFDLAAQFPATGRIDLNGLGAWCTGSLVAPNKVLTAAHCTSGFAAGDFSFKLGNDVSTSPTTRAFSALSVHPSYNGSEVGDLSVLTLNNPILNVDPMPITSLSPVGEVGTMIGFGDHGTGLTFNSAFDSRKRAAQNLISVANAMTLRSDFDHPNGSTSTFNPTSALPLEGTTAGGDSGGPLTVDFGFGEAIVGVLHGGFNDFGPNSRYGDISIWSPIDRGGNIGYLESEGLTIIHTFTPATTGDFDGNGHLGCEDIDVLTGAIAIDSADLTFDLDGNGTVDLGDRDAWLATAGAENLPSGNPYPLGDMNLDGHTDAGDFEIWNTNKFTPNASYCGGDLNADGFINGRDFLVWNAHKFDSADAVSFPAGAVRPGTHLAVPEPHCRGEMILAFFIAALRYRRQLRRR